MSVEKNDLQKKSGIYIIKNILNNKIYIGSTTNLRRRFWEHFGCLRKNKHTNSRLQRAFNKHTEAYFTFKIIIVCEMEQLEYYEDKLIELWEPEYNLEFGFKRRKGQYKPSKETIEKMSLAKKGKSSKKRGSKISQEQKDILRDVNIGNQNASKDYSSIILISPDGNNVTLGRNLNEFCRKHNLNVGDLHSVIHGTRPSHRGWILGNGVI